MAITETQRKSRVILLVGDVNAAGVPTTDGTGLIATNIDLLWDTYVDLGDLYLQELYTRRDAIVLVLAKVSLTADTAIGRDLGLSVRKSDRAKAYQKMLDDTNKLINNATSGAVLNGTENIGELTTKTPISDADQPAFLVRLR